VTWAWLLAWNAFWLVWALAYMSLEAKLGKGGGSPQAGRDRRRLEGRPMGRPTTALQEGYELTVIEEDEGWRWQERKADRAVEG
jgi:hypothetical protein